MEYYGRNSTNAEFGDGNAGPWLQPFETVPAGQPPSIESKCAPIRHRDVRRRPGGCRSPARRAVGAGRDPYRAETTLAGSSVVILHCRAAPCGSTASRVRLGTLASVSQRRCVQLRHQIDVGDLTITRCVST